MPTTPHMFEPWECSDPTPWIDSISLYHPQTIAINLERGRQLFLCGSSPISVMTLNARYDLPISLMNDPPLRTDGLSVSFHINSGVHTNDSRMSFAVMFVFWIRSRKFSRCSCSLAVPTACALCVWLSASVLLDRWFRYNATSTLSSLGKSEMDLLVV